MVAMLLDALMVVVGLVLLAVGGDRFVLSAARVARALALSPVLVGVALIGLGTSLPELVVSALAAAQGTQDLAIGNVVGSNTANLLLVLGVAAVARPLAVRGLALTRELPLTAAATVLLALLAADGVLGLVDALVLLVGALGVVALLARAARGGHGAPAAPVVTPAAAVAPDPDPSAAAAEADAAAPERPRALPALGVAALALLATLGGAQLLIRGAVGLAEAAGVSDVVIGVTVVAVGTSLPEIGTALAAARRREPELVIGNVLGSNLFNSLPVAGVAALIDTAPLAPSLQPNLLVMLGATVLAGLVLWRGRVVGRVEALVLLVAYAGAVAVAVSAG